jgi:hypothetical protein
LRASFARRMLQYVPAPPANGSFSAAAGTSVTGTLVGVGIGGTAPVWNSTPSLSVTATQSGFAAFSFTGTPTSVTVEPGDTLPGWVSAITVAGISWNTSAVAGSAYSFRLRATNAFGYSTSNAISGTVAAAPASSGFFAGWTPQQYVAIRSLSSAPDGSEVNGMPCTGKQTRLIAHPDGKQYFFGGDTPNSGDQRIWTLNPGTWQPSTPSTGWTMVHPWWPNTGNVYPVHHDCSSVVWDSKRRVFWQVGGYNYTYGGTTPPEYGGPAGVTGFRFTVGEFNPAKAIGTQWRDTGVQYQLQALDSLGGEYVGPAVYDPVLDLVFHGGDRFWNAKLHAFDPATPGTEKFAFVANFSQPQLEISTGGALCHVVGIDVANRWIWIIRQNRFWDSTNNRPQDKTKHIYRVDLPSTRSGLPADGSGIDWTSRATLVWTNPGTGKDLSGGTPMIDGDTRKLYFWLRGPISAYTDNPPAGWGNNYKFGQCGRPESPMLNGTYGSANTGVLLDLVTGAEEFTQLPLMEFEDGQGWIMPSNTTYFPKSGTLFYSVADEYACPNSLIKARHYTFRARSRPSWAPASNYAWTQVPNSQASVNFTGADRTLYTGSEASGGRANELNADGQNPWFYSTGTLKREGSVLLFHGGGGQAGRSNAILAFHANAETPYWSLPMPPTPKSLTISDAAWGGSGFTNWTWEFNHRFDNNLVESSYNGQPTPVAVHTYSSAKFIDSEGMWLRFGTQMVHPNDGMPVFANGQGRNGSVHGFRWSETSKSADSRLWSINAKANGFEAESGQLPNRSYAKHPWTEDVIGGSSGRFHWWKRATNTWQSRVENFSLSSDYIIVGIDPINNVALFTNGAAAPYSIDLDATSPSAQAGTWSGSFPGASKWAWDEDNACFWFITSAFALYKVQLTNKAARTWTVTAVSTTGTAPTTYKPEEGITLEWSAELGGLLCSTSYSRPIWFIRTAARA